MSINTLERQGNERIIDQQSFVPGETLPTETIEQKKPGFREKLRAYGNRALSALGIAGPLEAITPAHIEQRAKTAEVVDKPHLATVSGAMFEHANSKDLYKRQSEIEAAISSGRRNLSPDESTGVYAGSTERARNAMNKAEIQKSQVVEEAVFLEQVDAIGQRFGERGQESLRQAYAAAHEQLVTELTSKYPDSSPSDIDSTARRILRTEDPERIAQQIDNKKIAKSWREVTGVWGSKKT